MPEGSVTLWIAALHAGPDRAAAEALWRQYFEALAVAARDRLQQRFRRAGDEEDIALSALDSALRGIREQRFPELDDRNGLWKLLLTITDRKAKDHVARERTQKRGGGKVRGESVFEADPASPGLAGWASPEPSPEFTALLAEECRTLLDRLDEGERQIALWKLEGWTNEEVAQRSGRSLRSVERKLQLIRKLWKEHVDG